MIIEAGQGVDFLNLKYTGATGSDIIGTIECETLDGGTTGIRVAMPWLLRAASYDALEINTITYEFTSSFVRNAEPDAVPAGNDWDEELFMPYNVGDIITVIPNDGTVADISDAEEIPYVELSNNRIWGRSCP